MSNAWGSAFGSAWRVSWGQAPQPAVVLTVEGPNVYQLTGGYPPPLKKPLELRIPDALQALMKKSDAQIQYEKRLKKLAPLELL